MDGLSARRAGVWPLVRPTLGRSRDRARDRLSTQLAGAKLRERMTRLRELLTETAQLLHERQLLTDNGKGDGESQSLGVRRVALDFFQAGI